MAIGNVLAIFVLISCTAASVSAHAELIPSIICTKTICALEL